MGIELGQTELVILEASIHKVENASSRETEEVLQALTNRNVQGESLQDAGDLGTEFTNVAIKMRTNHHLEPSIGINTIDVDLLQVLVKLSESDTEHKSRGPLIIGRQVLHTLNGEDQRDWLVEEVQNSKTGHVKCLLMALGIRNENTHHVHPQKGGGPIYLIKYIGPPRTDYLDMTSL